MSKYNQEMNKAEANTKDLGKSSDNLAGTLKGLFTLAMVQQVAGFVGEMVNLGTEANATESRFRELTKTMGDYDETMNGLRAATLGTVDDMHLQQGAMLLVQTAGIETNEELQRMMNLITMTKKPSEDMTTAIQNFGLMLANNSILRLDSFGISASKVRARILELKETMGLDRSEAFRMAVLEEGEKNIKKFGDAAGAASASLSRLEVWWENRKQNFAERMSSGAQGWGLALEYMLGITPQQQAAAQAKADAVAAALAEDLNQSLIDALAGPGFGMDAGFITRYVETALTMAAEDPALTSDIDNFMAAVFRRMGATVGDTAPFRDILQNTLDVHRLNQEDRDAAAEIAEQREREAEALAQSAENQRIVLSFTDQLNDLNERNTREHIKQLEVEQQMVGIRAQYAGQLGETGQEAFSSAFRFNGQMNPRTGVPDFLTQLQADEIRASADSVAELVDQMHDLDKANDDLYTDEELERADAYSEKLNNMADEAQNAADAFKNMSLADIFGTSSGGSMGEGLDLVISKMKELGRETWEINNAQRAFDFASGQENLLSLAFKDQITMSAVQIYDQFGGQAAANFIGGWDNMMKNAKLRGININDADFVAQSTQFFQSHTTGAFGTNEITEFLDKFDPAKQNAAEMQASMQDMGTVSGDLTSNMDLAKASGADLAGSMMKSNKYTTNMASDLKDAHNELENMSKKTYALKLKPEMVDIPAFMASILAPLVQMVQAAGGTMPGTSQQASQSGPMVQQAHGY